MRILALDVGDQRIGVAVSDAIGLTAQPVTVVQRQSAAKDLDAIEALRVQRQAEKIVVGLPLTLRGEQGPQAKKVVAFAEALRQKTGVAIELVDERFTTAQAQRVMLDADASRRKRKQVIDQVAAQLILQSYLDTHRPS